MVIALIVAVAVFAIIGSVFWLIVKALDQMELQTQKLFKGFDARDKKAVDTQDQTCTIHATPGTTSGNKTKQETPK